MSIRNAMIKSVCALAMALPAASQAATCSDKLGPAEQIACLQTQNAVLKELIASKELYKKLDEAGDKKPRHLSLPTVLSIFGAHGTVNAVLSYAGTGGGSLTVKPGSHLPDGWQVRSIEQGQVVIAKGKVSQLLLLAGGSPQQPVSAPSPGIATAMPQGSVMQAPPFPATAPVSFGDR